MRYSLLSEDSNLRQARLSLSLVPLLPLLLIVFPVNPADSIFVSTEFTFLLCSYIFEPWGVLLIPDPLCLASIKAPRCTCAVCVSTWGEFGVWLAVLSPPAASQRAAASSSGKVCTRGTVSSWPQSCAQEGAHSGFIPLPGSCLLARHSDAASGSWRASRQVGETSLDGSDSEAVTSDAMQETNVC